MLFFELILLELIILCENEGQEFPDILILVKLKRISKEAPHQFHIFTPVDSCTFSLV